MKLHQLVWRQDKAGRGKYKYVELVLPADASFTKLSAVPCAADPYITVNVGLEIEAPPDSEFLLPTFISPAQRKLLWAFVCSVLCFGVFAGIVFILAVLAWSGSDGGGALAESGNLTLPSNASDNCKLTYDPDDFSELTREVYVRTFFNVTCLATNGTGDPCDLHLAEEYTHRMFSALRFDRLVMEFLALVAIFSLAQIGGIPRPTDWSGMFFWIAWMATQLAQYVVILCALILQVFSFLGVRARLSPCLVQVDGTALLDFYAMCTFAVQPELVIKATMLFVYSFLLSLGMLVSNGSREWPWLSKLEVTAEATASAADSVAPVPSSPEGTRSVAKPAARPTAEPTAVESAADPPAEPTHLEVEETSFTTFGSRAAQFLQSLPKAIPRVTFEEDAAGPIMPKDKRFKARLSLSLCHYHAARTIVLGACFSMWAALGSPAAAPGVTSAWVLALLVAVLTKMVPWSRLVRRHSASLCTSDPVHYIMSLIIFCPLLSASAILPLSALFMLVVEFAYFLGLCVLAHIGPAGEDGKEQVWVGLPEGLTDRCCCKWTDALAGPTRTCLSWIQSTSNFSYLDGVLGRSQGKALPFTSTSHATLAGGLSCFWVLLAVAPVASHAAWARARSLASSEGVARFANDTTLAVEDVGGLTGEWSWVWVSLMVWLWLGVAIILCCCALANVLAGCFVTGMYCFVYRKATFLKSYVPKCYIDLFGNTKLNSTNGIGLPLRTRWLMKTAFACALFALLIFIFTASQTADAKELIATTYASSSVALSGLQLDWNGALPSFDELVKVLNDPAAALSNVVQRIANLSSYAKFDPAYFSEGVQALTAINLVLSFVKLLATYGRKLFALRDAAKSMLKTYTGHETGSEGDDGTVQVCETMTDLAAIAILGLLNKNGVKSKLGDEVSFAKLVLQEELSFDGCSLNDGDLAGLVALVTHPEMAVKLRSLSLKGNDWVTAEAWEKALTHMLTKGSLTTLLSLNLQNNDIGIKGAKVVAKVLRVNGSLTTLNLADNDIGKEGGVAIAEALKVNGSLTSLNLYCCGLGPEGGVAISEALKVNGSLTKIGLTNNGLDDTTRTSLKEAAKLKTGFTLDLYH